MNWDDIKIGHLFEMKSKPSQYNFDEGTSYLCIRGEGNEYFDIELSYNEDMLWSFCSPSSSDYNSILSYYELVSDHGRVIVGLPSEDLCNRYIKYLGEEIE